MKLLVAAGDVIAVACPCRQQRYSDHSHRFDAPKLSSRDAFLMLGICAEFSLERRSTVAIRSSSTSTSVPASLNHPSCASAVSHAETAATALTAATRVPFKLASKSVCMALHAFAVCNSSSSTVAGGNGRLSQHRGGDRHTGSRAQQVDR